MLSPRILRRFGACGAMRHRPPLHFILFLYIYFIFSVALAFFLCILVCFLFQLRSTWIFGFVGFFFFVRIVRDFLWVLESLFGWDAFRASLGD